MLPLLLAGAAALAIGPPIHAIAASGVSKAQLERSDYWVQVTTFDLQHVPWTVMCMKAYTGTGILCQARNVDVLRDAQSARFEGTELRLSFKGKDQFGPFDFVVEIDGLSAG